MRSLRERRALAPAAVAALAIALAISGAAALAQDAGAWREAEPGYRYTFPRDHSAHPDYRVEWWYFTGNVETDSGERLGYQLTFFRTGVDREPENPSRWAVRDLHLAHFAVTDLERGTFQAYERANRAGVGWAGAATGSPRVWNEDWEARLEGEAWVLRARAADDTALSLRLEPRKPPVVHGEDGVSRKGSSEGNASCYYSLTRIATSGTIELDGVSRPVRGLSWMDHEFGTTFLEEAQVGWDWISIQLADGRDLMVFRIRDEDGASSVSSGTLVLRDGTAVPLSPEDFTLRPGRTWRSAATGAEYPVSWRVSLPGRGLELEVEAAVDSQELRTPESTGVSYWEGSVVVEGRGEERRVSGRGYLEMTGYAGKPLSRVLR